MLLLVILCLLPLPLTKSLPVLLPGAADQVSAGYRSSVRLGREVRDYSRLEIMVRTAGLVEDSGDLARTGVSVEVKSGGERWRVVESEASVRGGVYTWQVAVAPCLSHRVRLWLEDRQGGQTSFELPHLVEAVSSRQMVESGYRPDTPGQLNISSSVSQVSVSWPPVTCAELYDVTYTSLTSGSSWSRQTSEPSLVLREGVLSCTEYEIAVTAVLQSQYSQESLLTFLTPPDSQVALSLDPIVLPSVTGITARWRGFQRLSCIRDYRITVCKEGNECPEQLQISRDDALILTEFSSSVTLEQCTDYSLHIKPLWQGDNLYEKVVNFRTLSPPLANISQQLAASQASQATSHNSHILLQWKSVDCGSQYKVWTKYQDYQTSNLEQRDWEMIGVTSKNYFQHASLACTEYRFGLSVLVGQEESEIVSLASSVMTNIDTSVVFSPPNLEISPSESGAEVRWDHRKCIISYRVETCRQERSGRAGSLCSQSEVITDETTESRLSHTVSSLQSCSNYSLSVYPTTHQGELTAQTFSFTSGAPPPSPPAELNLRISQAGEKLEISWSEVECATGYRIHQKLEHSDTETVWISQNDLQLYLSLDSPEPCVNYSYGVSALVGERESQPSQWVDIPVPPRLDQSHHLQSVSHHNLTTTFTLSKGVNNQNCKVEKYQIRHEGEEYFLEPEALHEGTFVVKLKEKGAKIEARIKYQGYHNWTRWISSQEKVNTALLYLTRDMLSLLPVLVISATVISLLCVLTICIVKKKRSELKYEEEVAKHNEECQELQKQLNEKYFNSS